MRFTHLHNLRQVQQLAKVGGCEARQVAALQIRPDAAAHWRATLGGAPREGSRSILQGSRAVRWAEPEKVLQLHCRPLLSSDLILSHLSAHPHLHNVAHAAQRGVFGRQELLRLDFVQPQLLQGVGPLRHLSSSGPIQCTSGELRARPQLCQQPAATRAWLTRGQGGENSGQAAAVHSISQYIRAGNW